MNNTAYGTALKTELAIIIKDLSQVAHFNKVTGDWEAVPEAPAETGDLNTTADAAEESTERQAITSSLETRYRNISLALTKINEGTFGICELCAEPIEEARLDANPAARTCIADRDRAGELPL